MAVRLAVLASGRGSNFAAIADAVKQGTIPDSEVCALVCSKAEAPAIALAHERGIPVHLVLSADYVRAGKLDRSAYEAELLGTLRALKPDFLCLAGYMLLLGEPLLKTWENRIVNIHPSLLPEFKGLKAQRQAIEAKVKWSGCTVHIVTREMDAGPILAQERVPVLETDDEFTLSERILAVEHQTYIRGIKALLQRS